MARKFDPSFFEKVKGSMETAKSSGGGSFENILKFPVNEKPYVLKLIPDFENPEKSFFHHKVHQFKSPKTGQFVSVLSLQTFGERDPIAEYRWKKYQAWDKANPNRAKDVKYKGEIDQKEQWLTKAYVLEYPGDDALVGKTKLLRIGPQIKNIIDDSTDGKRKDEIGWGLFDPQEGFDLKIVAEQQGEFTTFKNSFVTTKSKHKLTDDEVEAIFEEADKLKLDEVYQVKTYQELVDLLEEHFGEVEDEPEEEVRKPLAKVKQKSSAPATPALNEDPDDDIPMFHDDGGDVDEELDAILGELED